MMSIDDNGLFKIFPVIETITKELEYQNSMLNKIVLTGKINALNIAENLFNFTEQTAKTFASLQTELIKSLLDENRKELFFKVKSKAQMAIDTLYNSLFSRVADIQLLSKDENVVKFLKREISREEIKRYLAQYLRKYSIYNELILFDTEGNLKSNVNEENRIRFSKDPIFAKLQKEDRVLVEFRKTDMFIKQRQSLFFAHKVRDEEGNVIGVVVLFYKFNEEMNTIFNSIKTDKEIITIVDEFNNVLVSSEKGVDKNFVKVVNKVGDYVVANNYFHVKVESSQNIGELPKWYAITSHSRLNDINIINSFNDTDINRRLERKHLSNKELEKLSNDGYAILEDLSDVIINGELIAAKSKQYILIPILDNLREVSFRVVKLIELSISNLQNIIDEALLNETKSLSNFVMQNLLRVLYERVNDVKWWAMLPQFKRFLENGDSRIEVKNFLQYINTLYPFYSDILIYDRDGKVVAISHNQGLLGESITYNYTSSNLDSDKYFMSPFEKSKFYNNKPTYIFYASILSSDEHSVIGGIGVVCDSEFQFRKILDTYTPNERGIGVIVNQHREIISSTNELFKVLEEFKLDIELIDGAVSEVQIDSKTYKVAVSFLYQYREFINRDLYSVMMIEK